MTRGGPSALVTIRHGDTVTAIHDAGLAERWVKSLSGSARPTRSGLPGIDVLHCSRRASPQPTAESKPESPGRDHDAAPQVKNQGQNTLQGQSRPHVTEARTISDIRLNSEAQTAVKGTRAYARDAQAALKVGLETFTSESLREKGAKLTSLAQDNSPQGRFALKGKKWTWHEGWQRLKRRSRCS